MSGQLGRSNFSTTVVIHFSDSSANCVHINFHFLLQINKCLSGTIS